MNPLPSFVEIRRLGRMESATKFGQRLKSIREARKLSLRKLAYMAQTQASWLGRIERGKARPGPETLVAIADALKLSTDFLLGRNVTAPPSSP